MVGLRVFVTGSMRSGTTLLARWLGEALPGPTTALRETGITLTAHQLLTVLESNQRSHEFGFSLPDGSPLRDELLRGVASIAAELYRRQGHANGRHLVDKQPYVLGDASMYYDHLYELFPEIKIIATVRAPEPTIASMLRRTWGRGPWPRPAVISPVGLHLSPAENVLGDLNEDGSVASPGPADGVRRWSLAKACLHYTNSLVCLSASQVPRRGLVLDYDRLGSPATRARIEEFLELPLTRDVAFEPSGIEPRFSEEDRDAIRQATGAALELYAGWAEWEPVA